jgi:hypothetical protein
MKKSMNDFIHEYFDEIILSCLNLLGVVSLFSDTRDARVFLVWACALLSAGVVGWKRGYKKATDRRFIVEELEDSILRVQIDDHIIWLRKEKKDEKGDSHV